MLPLLLSSTAFALDIVRVDVVAYQHGWVRSEASATLLPDGDSYRDVTRGVAVPAPAVADLGRALDAPVVPAVTLATIGFDGAKLREHTEGVLPADAEALPGQRALFAAACSDAARVAPLVPRLYGGARHTDDYPSITLTVTTTQGDRIVLASQQQVPLMLPWQIERAGVKATTWDGSLARAIAGVMPEGFPNRERAAGKGLAEALARACLMSIAEEWDELGAREKAADAIARVGPRFEVASQSVKGIGSVDTDLMDERWNALLRSRTGAPALLLSTSLPYREEKVWGVSAMLARADHDLALVDTRAGAWIAAHPGTVVEVRNLGARSLGEKAEASVVADLRTGGRSDLAAEVSAAAEAVVFVEVTEPGAAFSRWIIFPDGRWLLWQVQGRATSSALWVDLTQAAAFPCGPFLCGRADAAR